MMSIKRKTIFLGFVGLCALLASYFIASFKRPTPKKLEHKENDYTKLIRRLVISWQQRLWPENPAFNDPSNWASPPVYDHTCPFALTKNIMYTGRDPEGANELSRTSGALEATSQLLNHIHTKNSKIVLVGDSIMRQAYSSLACLSFVAGGRQQTEVIDQFVRPSTFGGLAFSDGRMSFRGGGELIYAPEAGSINIYQWKEPQAAVKASEDWIKSCKERKPFLLDTYVFGAPHERVEPGTEVNNTALEKVVLTSNDFVVISASLHMTRDFNIANLTNLLDCIDEATAENGDLNWPNIVYLRSSPQHYWSQDGEYDTEDKSKNSASQLNEKCRDSIDRNAHNRLQEDIEKFGNRIPIVGEHLDVENHGKFHIASIKNEDTGDCTHWTMPGVTDLYAGEIAKWVVRN